MPSVENAEESPLARYTPQLVGSPVIELQSRTDHEVAKRAGHEDFTRSGERGHARANVHRDAADVIAADLTFAGVQPGSHLDA